MIYEYDDPYLFDKGDITPRREEKAIAEVEKTGITDPFWVERLVVTKTYMITCEELMSEENDIYKLKYDHYEKKYRGYLSEALADKKTQNSVTFEIGRG